jgi:hypothetical protein
MRSKKTGKSKSLSRRRKRIILIAVFTVISAIAIFITTNLNTLLSEKIMEIYNRSEVHKYYSLKFDKLRVNIFTGNVNIADVELSPVLQNNYDWFEKHGSIKAEIKHIRVKGADIIDFLKNDRINVNKFNIKKAEVFINNTGEYFRPFAFIRKRKKNDSTSLMISVNQIRFNDSKLIYINKKNSSLVNHLEDFNLEVDDLEMNKNAADFIFKVERFRLSMNSIALSVTGINQLNIGKFALNISKIDVNNKEHKFKYSYDDFNILLNKSSFVTPDNNYDISVERAEIDHISKFVRLEDFQMKPLKSKKQFAAQYRFKKLQTSLSVKNADIYKMDFDRLTKDRIIAADSIVLKNVDAILYNDGTKSVDTTRIPHYPGKQLLDLKQQLDIPVIAVRNASVKFSSKRKKGKKSSVEINSIDAVVSNLKNDSVTGQLTVTASGKIEKAVPFFVTLKFDYGFDKFSFNGRVRKSNLSALSKMVASFAPVKIASGKLRNMVFSGDATADKAKGTMTFLYSNLKLDFQTGKVTTGKKGFRNKILSTIANSYIYLNNPEPEQPVRKVKFTVKRDMHKGFLNLLIKSILAGIRETALPSKENRKVYKQNRKTQKVKKKADRKRANSQ